MTKEPSGIPAPKEEGELCSTHQQRPQEKITVLFICNMFRFQPRFGKEQYGHRRLDVCRVAFPFPFGILELFAWGEEVQSGTRWKDGAPKGNNYDIPNVQNECDVEMVYMEVLTKIFNSMLFTLVKQCLAALR